MKDRDYTKDIAILVAGTGASTKENTEALLDGFVFGDLDSVEATLIFPVLSNTGEDLIHVWNAALAWGFKLVIVQNENAGHKIMSTWDQNPNVSLTRHASDRDAMDTAFSFLVNHDAVGDDTAFIMAFNPDSRYVKDDPAMPDEEILGEFKELPWLKTLNLSDGLMDSFPGYETAQEKEDIATAVEEFEASQVPEVTEKVEEKPSEPRKRAPRKTVTQKDVPVLAEPETGVQNPSSRIHEDGCTGRKNHAGDCKVDLTVGSVVEVAGIPFVKKGPNPYREPLPTGELSATVQLPAIRGLLEHVGIDPEDKEVYVEAPKDTVTVAKQDLILLGESMKSMGQGFTDAISVLTRILENN